MNDVIELNLFQFSLIYLLLLIVAAIMKVAKVDQTKLLLIASVRMTVQLVIAGYILTYIMQGDHPYLTIAYLVVMVTFTILRVLNKNKELNTKFKVIIALSIALPGFFIIVYFLVVVIGVTLSEPQYLIPISGIVMGNIMTGVSLGIKTFRESLNGQRQKIEALQAVGAAPKNILLPFVRQGLESALLPTLNSMVGLGIVSLPGIMTGQILSGTLPSTAILYQIAIMVAICAAVCIACFSSLYFGYKTMFDAKRQIIQL